MTRKNTPQTNTPAPTEAQKAALGVAGIDWDKLKNLPWAQILAVLQAIFQALLDRQPVYAADAAASGHAHEEHLRTIFEMQMQLAQCGLCCLDHCHPHARP